MSRFKPERNSLGYPCYPPIVDKDGELISDEDLKLVTTKIPLPLTDKTLSNYELLQKCINGEALDIPVNTPLDPGTRIDGTPDEQFETAINLPLRRIKESPTARFSECSDLTRRTIRSVVDEVRSNSDKQVSAPSDSDDGN